MPKKFQINEYSDSLMDLTFGLKIGPKFEDCTRYDMINMDFNVTMVIFQTTLLTNICHG